ncbi:hypothetical protein NDU88_005592, partial [Pleurodeles waltl]
MTAGGWRLIRETAQRGPAAAFAPPRGAPVCLPLCSRNSSAKKEGLRPQQAAEIRSSSS